MLAFEDEPHTHIGSSSCIFTSAAECQRLRNFLITVTSLAVHLEHDLERHHLPCPITSARQVEHNSHCAGLTLSVLGSNKNNGIAVVVMTMHILMIRMMRSSFV